MSMYGMTISPMMMNVGRTTPACQGPKKTSISWRPRKYDGAFDGFGVRVARAGRTGRSLERRVDQQRPDQQQKDDQQRAQELAAHQERPGVHLVVAGAGRLLDRHLDPLAGERGDRGLRLGRCHRQLSSSSRSAARRADQKIRTSTNTRKNGSTITRPPGIRNARTTRIRLPIAYFSSDGISRSERRTGEAVAPDAPEVTGQDKA